LSDKKKIKINCFEQSCLVFLHFRRRVGVGKGAIGLERMSLSHTFP
jgi:hypothetical protein